MGFTAKWWPRRSARNVALRADHLVRDAHRMLADGRAADAEPMLTEAIAIRSARSDPSALHVVSPRMTRVGALGRLGRLAEAEAEARDLVTIVAAAPHLRPLRATAHGTLAAVLLASHRAQEAVDEFDVLLAQALPQDKGLIAARMGRAAALSVLGRHAEAAEQSRELASAIATEHGPGDTRALRARGVRAQNLSQLGRFEEAEAECRDLIAAAAALDEPDASALDRSARNALVFSLVGQGRAVEAEAEAREAIRLAGTAQRPDGQYPVALHLGLARALNAQGRHEEALRTAQAAEQAYAEASDARRHLVGAIRLALGTAHLGLGRLDEARRATDLARADCMTALGPHHHRALEIGTLDGRVLAAEGRPVAAREQLAATTAAWRRHFGADHPGTLAAETALAAVR